MPPPDPKSITDEDFRKAGLTGAARSLPRDELAMRLLCAFNGVTPAQAPPAWWFHPNTSTRDAWTRVADEIEAAVAARQCHPAKGA